ncbi:DNA-binding protein SMUBP-2 [Strongyloides ratti]|uniref:DNA-binding protein SMUBP-2 n=1 Tax=Strongyloides ratti TaxID=34506 RepID=A0A090L0V4_STRRB|nr:DNA-binding protein SMUBP-2 [Strongyloides ratti]CEF63420.1 DNA-binding protein SMUBP-2 [Strongyloides ratti]
MRFLINNFVKYLNFRSSTYIIRTFASSKQSKKKDTSIPSLLKERIESYKKILTTEIDLIEKGLKSNTNGNTKEKNTVFNDIRIKKISFHPVHGKTLEIRDYKLVGLTTKNLKFGIPFDLEIDKQSFETIVLEYDSTLGKIILKILDRALTWTSSIEQKLCSLKLSSKSNFKNILTFISKPNFFTAPGWNTMKIIYKGSAAPTTYSDININLIHGLNETQQKAVKASLNSKRNILCINGPPGTGKTKVIAEIIKQLKAKKKKILVVTPRIDVIVNIMKHFNKEDIKNSCVFGDETNSIDEKMKGQVKFDDLDLLSNLISESVNTPYSSFIPNYIDLANYLNSSIRIEIVKESQIIYTTVGRNLWKYLQSAKFVPDVVILEEASQILECAAWQFLLAGKRSIVVGDFNQLTSNFSSIPESEVQSKCPSILEYLWNNVSSSCKILLNTQYRTNEKIMKWSSKIFYDNAMIAHDNNKNILLSDISNIKKNSGYNSPLLIFDLKDFKNSFERQNNSSYFNMNEVLVCVKYVKFLLRNNIKENDIGIITPYSAQQKEIKKNFNNIKVSTVDGFQGQEKEVIVFCFVRNNKYRQIGFLNNEKRMNVALTRAKRQFVFIGNTDMLNGVKSFIELQKIFSDAGKSIDAKKFLSDSNI